MAVYSFGIDEDQDIKKPLADNGVDIGAGTQPLNNESVTAAVQYASANVIALADAMGFAADAALLVSNEATHLLLKDMAIAGAVELLAMNHGRMSALAVVWRERFQTARSELNSQGQTFGAAVPGVSEVPHVVDDKETGRAAEIGNWDWEGPSEGNF